MRAVRFTSGRQFILLFGLALFLLGLPTAEMGEGSGMVFVLSGTTLIAVTLLMAIKAPDVFNARVIEVPDPPKPIEDCFVLRGSGLSLNKGTRCTLTCGDNALTITSELDAVDDIVMPFRNMMWFEVGGPELVDASPEEALQARDHTILRVIATYGDFAVLVNGMSRPALREELAKMAEGVATAEVARSLMQVRQPQPRDFDAGPSAASRPSINW